MARIIRQVITSALSEIMKWSKNPRIYLWCFFMFIYIWGVVRGFADFARDVSVNVSPWVFPFIMTSNSHLNVIALGALVLFADVPFYEPFQLLLIIRSGRKSWVAGKMLYIVLASFAYVMFIIIVSIAALLPHIDFSGEWGKIINTLEHTTTGRAYGYASETSLVSGVSDILIRYSPFEATIKSAATLGLVLAFTGSMELVVGMLINKQTANIAAAGLIALDYAVYALDLGFGGKHYFLSPLSWVSPWLAGKSGSPSYPFAFICLTLMTILMFVLAHIHISKCSIDLNRE